MEEDVIAEISGLWFGYGDRPVLRDVSLSVRRGDFLAMIGPNGGGKTTLLKLMLGLLKPDRGRVRLFGKPPADSVRRVGYVPQDAHANRRFPVTALDVVLMGGLLPGRLWRRISNRDRLSAHKALDRMGMGAYCNRRIGELSGGQRQRVFIARALFSRPEALLLDEPTANVDSRGQSEFYSLLQDLNREITIVVVSHDLMTLSSHVKSVACVNRGLHYHDQAEITSEMFESMYPCPVEIIAHGFPHRVLREHGDL